MRSTRLRRGLRLAGLAVVFLIATSAVGVASAGSATTPSFAPTANDVVVYSVADGASATTTTGGTKTAGDVTLDEFAPDTGSATESVVSWLTFPDDAMNDTDAEHALTASGVGTSEGELTLAGDGSCLLATGYDASAGTKKVASTASTGTDAVPRTVAEVYADGSFDTSTALTDFANGNNPRSATAATCDSDTTSSSIYVGGAAGGVRIATLGATTSTELTDPTNYDNVRQVQVVDGQLYTSADPTKNDQSAPLTIAPVGSGLPSTSDTDLDPTDLDFADEPGTTTSEAPVEPYGYSLLQINSDSSGVDTLYVADNGMTPAGATVAGAIVKYYLDPENDKWTEEGAVSLPNVIGLAAQDVGDSGTVDIYATTSDGGNAVDSTTGDSSSDGGLWELTDVSGFGEELTGTPQEIYAAPVGTELRGVAFAPGTDLGSGGGTGNGAGAAISFSSPSDGLPATLGAPTNPTLPITVADSDQPAGGDPVLAVTSSSNITVAPLDGISVQETGTGTGQWTLSVTPGDVGTSTITLTATDSDCNSATYAIPYGVSAATASGDRYYSGAGNASTEIWVGDGYFIAGDDLNNTLHLYKSAVSGPPVSSWDFDSQLPDGSSSIDIEAAAETTDSDGDTIIYWLGSQSSATTPGQTPPAPDTLFATEVTGSGAATQLTYLGSYMGLRDDLIAWDVDNGNPLGLDNAGGQPVKSWQGLDIEGLEFAPSSTTTAYLAFRAPTDEPYASGDGFDALLVPVTDLTSLIPLSGPSATGATFGHPIEMDLGGLGIRELRKNADNQYLIVAGTSDSSDLDAQLYTWDGERADAPTLTGTALPSVADGAWEGIVSVPDPLVAGSTVELIEDNGDTDWYGTGLTANSGLLDGLQKDLGRTFTISALKTQSITYTSSAPTAAAVGGTYTPTATASSGLAVSFSVDPSSDSDACLVSGGVVTFTAPGECVIEATQAGNSSWASATADQSFAVLASLPSKTAKPSVVVGSGRLRVRAGKDKLSIPVRCRWARCLGRLTLSIAVEVEVHRKVRTRRRTIATGTYTIAAGVRRLVTLRLDKAGRALTASSVKAQLVASVKGGTKTTVVITLRTSDSGAART